MAGPNQDCTTPLYCSINEVVKKVWSNFQDSPKGVHRKALILNANVYNHCIRYKIPSGPVNIVGSFKYLVHLYFQYMSAAKLHQSCRTCHIIFNVEYLKSVKNVGLWYHWLTLTQGTHLNEEKNCSEHKYFVLYLMVFIHLIFLITFILHEW